MILIIFLALMFEQTMVKNDTINKKIYFISYRHEDIVQGLSKEFVLSLINLEATETKSDKDFYCIKFKNSKREENKAVKLLDFFCNSIILKLNSMLIKDKLLKKYMGSKLKERPLTKMIFEYLEKYGKTVKETVQKNTDFCPDTCQPHTNEEFTTNQSLMIIIEASCKIIYNILKSEEQSYINLCKFVNKKVQLIFLESHLKKGISKNDINHLYENKKIVFHEEDLVNLDFYHNFLVQLKNEDKNRQNFHYLFFKINLEYYLLKNLIYLYERKQLFDLEYRKKLSDDIMQIIKIKEKFDDLAEFFNGDKSKLNIQIVVQYENNAAKMILKSFSKKKNIVDPGINLLFIFHLYKAFEFLADFLKDNNIDKARFVEEIIKRANSVYLENKESEPTKELTSNDIDNIVTNVKNYIFDKNKGYKFSCQKIEEEESEAVD